MNKSNQPDKLSKEVLAFQPDVIELEHTPLPGGTRLVLYTIFAFLLATVIWATWAKVDRIVIAQGNLVAVGTRIKIQPLITSIVKSIHVTTGETVNKGQVLATLDPTLVQADLNNVEQRMYALRSFVNRLQAELVGQNYLPKKDEALTPQELQLNLFKQRFEEHRARTKQFSEQINSLDSALLGNSNQQKNLKKRRLLVVEIKDIHEALHKSLDISQVQYLEVQSNHLEITAQIENLQNERQRLEHELSERVAEQATFHANWKHKIAAELNDVRSRYLTTQQEYEKAVQQKSLVTLKAPSDGVVLEVGQFVLGSVVREAEPLMSLVPLNSTLEIEANILAKDIGRIRIGDEVRIKLQAFPFQRHGTLLGEVRVISEDSFKDEVAPGAPKMVTYRSRISILNNKLKETPKGYRLIPGMEASAEIKIGARRVIEYLIYPIIRAAGESMREP